MQAHEAGVGVTVAGYVTAGRVAFGRCASRVVCIIHPCFAPGTSPRSPVRTLWSAAP